MRGRTVLRDFPEPARAILYGILHELLALSPKLRVGRVSASDRNGVIKASYCPTDAGFRLTCSGYRLDVIICDGQLCCSISQRTRRYSGGGGWHGDLRDPVAFDRTVQYCKDSIASHLDAIGRHPLRKPWKPPKKLGQ